MSRRVWVRVWGMAAIGALLPLGCGDTQLVQCRRLIEAVAPAATLTLKGEAASPPPPTGAASPPSPTGAASPPSPTGAAPSPPPTGAAPPETSNSATSTVSNNGESAALAAAADRLEALALGVRGLSLGDRTLRDLQTRFDTYFSDSSRLLRDFAQAKSNPVPSALERLRQQAEDLQAREAALTAETNRYCAQ